MISTTSRCYTGKLIGFELGAPPCPISKSDEFSGVTTLVVEIVRCKVTTFSEKVTYLSVDGSVHSE